MFWILNETVLAKKCHCGKTIYTYEIKILFLISTSHFNWTSVVFDDTIFWKIKSQCENMYIKIPTN